MFENLDDPVPPTPASLDTVTTRGRRLRLQRRMIAGACALFVLAGGIATAAALDGGGHKKVVVANPTTTTGPDTTVPETTTIPRVTTTTVRKKAPAVPLTSVAPTTTSTTRPPHDPSDFSKVKITYAESPIQVEAGATKPITFTVMNTGTWDVELPDVCYGPTLWATPATSAWAPYTEGIWPQPFPQRGAGEFVKPCAPTLELLKAGASTVWYDRLIAGYQDAHGHVMPSPPGFTSYRPNFFPQCAQPCAPDSPNAVAVTISAPAWPAPADLYTISVTTLHLHAVGGAAVNVEMTYTNPLAFTVRMPVFGPCWKVKSGAATVDCSAAPTALIVGPNQTVDLVGTVWARRGFTATGAPLAPGRYALDLGDLHGREYALGDPFPVLTVT